jgi:hypothetical protein
MVRKIVFTIYFALCVIYLNAQNLILDDIQLMDVQRNNELKKDTQKLGSSSFMIRSSSFFQNHLENSRLSLKKSILKNFIFSYDQQENSLLPISYNDGNMFPARGWQERYSIGAHLQWKFIDINIQPEWLKVQNKDQEPYLGYPLDGNFAAKYFGLLYNRYDEFRQFGTGKIDTFNLGQSRIGIKTKFISLGVSNENIWWGPGKRNSLLMSKNAAGFKHLYIQNNQPIPSFVGNFEFSLISGQLDTTWFKPWDTQILGDYQQGAIQKNLDQRNLQGATINWQPKWLPNLYIGYAYTRQSYKHARNEYGQAYTFFSKDKVYQSFGSFMFRFLLPKDHAEFYGEIGLQDESAWPWKFFKEKRKAAFVIGVSKMVPLHKGRSWLGLNAEFAQLQLMDPRYIYYRGILPFYGGPPNSWYSNNSTILQGYTNNGQIIGASIGPGSNSQTIQLSWNKGLNKIGVQVDRVVHNNEINYQMYFNPYSATGYSYYNRYWVDLSTSYYVQIAPIKNILLTASFVNTDALNYRWVRNEGWWDEASDADKFNKQFQLSIKYLLHAINQ